MSALMIHRAGPGCLVQDLGRAGHLAVGLSRGGAADRVALYEAAALLNLPAPVAGIEMAMMGAEATSDVPTRIALTGAPMKAAVNGVPVLWNATLTLGPGDRLSIGPVQQGVYGYLTPAGGIKTPVLIGSRAAHLNAGLGGPVAAGDTLPIGDDPAVDAAPMTLPMDPRFDGGEVRVMPGPQSGLFDDQTRARFYATPFTRSPMGNRQGVRMDQGGAPFVGGTSSIASDLIGPGDIQMTGAGVPYVLLADCQTMGGYPRIGTVLRDDLARVAQAAPGASLRFRAVSVAQADADWRPEAAILTALRRNLRPLRRDPHDIADLLSYQLIGGVIRGDEE